MIVCNKANFVEIENCWRKEVKFILTNRFNPKNNFLFKQIIYFLLGGKTINSRKFVFVYLTEKIS
jgi:hypothetical protein